MLSFRKSTANDHNANAGISWRARLRTGLARTRDAWSALLGGKLDAQSREALEDALLSSDVGVAATTFLLQRVEAGIKKNVEPKPALRDALLELLTPIAQPLDITPHRPFVLMIVGVNGAGKTTTIGKIAHYYQAQGKSVLLAAGDTFRAAAREQLLAWGERNHVAVIAQQSGDPAAVIFDAVHAAQARNIDLVIADTAGRLPTQLHLMEELKKVKRVIAKAMPDAPHETLLVLDANTGQNAVNQVQAFDDALGVTGLALTKLDGTAKGGVIAAIARHKQIPLRFIGVGEGINDLQPFDVENAGIFVDALLGDA